MGPSGETGQENHRRRVWIIIHDSNGNVLKVNRLRCIARGSLAEVRRPCSVACKSPTPSHTTLWPSAARYCRGRTGRLVRPSGVPGRAWPRRRGLSRRTLDCANATALCGANAGRTKRKTVESTMFARWIAQMCAHRTPGHVRSRQNWEDAERDTASVHSSRDPFAHALARSSGVTICRSPALDWRRGPEEDGYSSGGVVTATAPGGCNRTYGGARPARVPRARVRLRAAVASAATQWCHSDRFCFCCHCSVCKTFAPVCCQLVMMSARQRVQHNLRCLGGHRLDKSGIGSNTGVWQRHCDKPHI